ncbi:hypothetical protein X777_11019 [Ooceraea biroi]|uniref:Uncharacterized protein n=1 Tax=Ooceraea biroi TaxID=2015173 RepID=A0A026W3U2_OOCBI|nr:hypothetical protein X777_11019 [Ooceraea biroi]
MYNASSTSAPLCTVTVAFCLPRTAASQPRPARFSSSSHSLLAYKFKWTHIYSFDEREVTRRRDKAIALKPACLLTVSRGTHRRDFDVNVDEAFEGNSAPRSNNVSARMYPLRLE